MAHPLELSYNWRTPAFFASVAAAICVSVLAALARPAGCLRSSSWWRSGRSSFC